MGVGTATGTGTVIGEGTVYVGGILPLITSGSTTGTGTVVGTGTVYGEGRFTGSGTFIGSGTFVGTGVASTMGIGMSLPTGYPGEYGTTVMVYPDSCFPFGPQMSDLPRLLDGNGTYANLSSFGASPYANPSASAFGSGRYANLTSSGGRFAMLNATNSTTNSSTPLCNVCKADIAICCPLGVPCGLDGHCPPIAVVNCGYTIAGKNITY